MAGLESNNVSWDDTFIEMCRVIAKRSKDPDTKIGSVIVGARNEVLSVGYNCFPRGVNHTRTTRPEKYHWIEHAERNAIYNAAAVGIPLLGSRIYTPGMPCQDCARAIIQSGITSSVVGSSTVPARWAESCKRTVTMFQEAGVFLREANKEYPTSLVIGEDWG